ncbi:MAG TPA: M15 family metallopeptidase [Candidatus Paceibacterota bacterium]|nr:M15 family metallopeptidase [Candidatus Paceibacterota bacterium]
MKNHLSKKVMVPVLAIIIFLAGLGYGGYRYYRLNRLLHKTEAELEATTTELTGRVQALEAALTETAAQKTELDSALAAEQGKAATLGEEVVKITDKVQTLEKLTQTDPELLKKYSRVYFLSEHYTPEALSSIDTEYIVPVGRALQFHTKALPFLADLLDDAADDGLALRIASAYRSFQEQKTLKSTYTVTYGTGANKFSADQGYSEHQLGTTVDFATKTIQWASAKFEPTPEYKWLTENAYKYGFVLSYPKNNTYYKFEPWHWRFVGIDLARDLHQDNKHLYDIDQREIDKYLLTIFD